MRVSTSRSTLRDGLSPCWYRQGSLKESRDGQVDARNLRIAVKLGWVLDEVGKSTSRWERPQKRAVPARLHSEKLFAGTTRGGNGVAMESRDQPAIFAGADECKSDCRLPQRIGIEVGSEWHARRHSDDSAIHVFVPGRIVELPIVDGVDDQLLDAIQQASGQSHRWTGTRVKIFGDVQSAVVAQPGR